MIHVLCSCLFCFVLGRRLISFTMCDCYWVKGILHTVKIEYGLYQSFGLVVFMSLTTWELPWCASKLRNRRFWIIHLAFAPGQRFLPHFLLLLNLWNLLWKNCECSSSYCCGMLHFCVIIMTHASWKLSLKPILSLFLICRKFSLEFVN